MVQHRAGRERREAGRGAVRRVRRALHVVVGQDVDIAGPSVVLRVDGLLLDQRRITNDGTIRVAAGGLIAVSRIGRPAVDRLGHVREGRSRVIVIWQIIHYLSRV